MKYVVRPNAKQDILQQYRYYISRLTPATAERFLDAVEDAFKDICRMPGAGSPWQTNNPALVGIRSAPVRGFEDIRVYYIVRKGKLRVLRVLHGRRDIHRIIEKETPTE